MERGTLARMRTTQANVKGVFQHLVKAMGGHVATSYDDVGGWQLAYNSDAGGYVIERILNQSGAVTQPFGSAGHGAGEMWEMIRFGLRLLEEMPHAARVGNKRSSRRSR